MNISPSNATMWSAYLALPAGITEKSLRVEKPNLLFFRSITKNLPEFILSHFTDQADCLRQYFNLHVVDETDCDLDVLCDQHHPDLLMFESGVYAGKRIIRNAHAHSDIPRLGFCNSDAYCPSRSVFLSDMDRWGVETFFTHAVAMPSYTPEIADRLFLWPNFVNPARFAFSPPPKDIPVLLTGSRASHYPWRNAISRILDERLSTTSTPHFGWTDASATSGMVVGDAYVQLLARSMFVPTCGSVAHEVVRKHFEIPAAGACLLTERTPAVEAAGYVDMENCVFAGETDVLEKVGYLLNHREELDRITRAGQELVLRRHTMRSRSQIADWLTLQRQRRSGQQIVQPNPFGPLELSTDASSAKWGGLETDNQHIVQIRNGLADIRRNDLLGARANLSRSNNLHLTSEATLGMALSCIRDGKPLHAIEWIWRIIDLEILMNALDIDPVEWATLIRALVCAGKLGEARKAAALIPWARHHELDRMRNLVELLSNCPPPALARRRSRPTLHRIDKVSPEDWRTGIVEDLRRCGQFQLGESVSRICVDEVSDDPASVEEGPSDEFVQQSLTRIHTLRNAHRWSLGSLFRRFRIRTSGPPARNIRTAFVRWALKGLGFETPELLREAATLAATADFEQIALHDVSTSSALVDAVFAAAMRNPTLHFEQPLASGDERRLGLRLLYVIGTRGIEKLNVDTLLERAEVVILQGVPKEKSSELISQMLADGRFIKSASPLPVGAAILRRSALRR